MSEACAGAYPSMGSHHTVSWGRMFQVHTQGPWRTAQGLAISELLRGHRSHHHATSHTVPPEAPVPLDLRHQPSAISACMLCHLVVQHSRGRLCEIIHAVHPELWHQTASKRKQRHAFRVTPSPSSTRQSAQMSFKCVACELGAGHMTIIGNNNSSDHPPAFCCATVLSTHGGWGKLVQSVG